MVSIAKCIESLRIYKQPPYDTCGKAWAIALGVYEKPTAPVVSRRRYDVEDDYEFRKHKRLMTQNIGAMDRPQR